MKRTCPNRNTKPYKGRERPNTKTQAKRCTTPRDVGQTQAVY